MARGYSYQIDRIGGPSAPMLRRSDLAAPDRIAPLLVEIIGPPPFCTPELNLRLALLRDAASWVGRLRRLENDDPMGNEECIR